jgi:hypothetical protein
MGRVRRAAVPGRKPARVPATSAVVERLIAPTVVVLAARVSPAIWVLAVLGIRGGFVLLLIRVSTVTFTVTVAVVLTWHLAVIAPPKACKAMQVFTRPLHPPCTLVVQTGWVLDLKPTNGIAAGEVNPA